MNHSLVDPQQESTTSTSCLNCASDFSTPWAWAEDVEYLTSDDRFEYRQCDRCGVVFIARPPTDRLDAIYPPNYYSFQSSEPSLLERVKGILDQRSIRAITATIPGDGIDVLDVGGGVGFMSDTAKRADRRVRRTVVVDLDDDCRVEAELRGHTFVCSRIEDFAADGQRFDLILAINLIEHVEAPRAVLAAFRALLNPGGRIVVKTPNIDALDARLFRHRSWGGLHCPRHWVLFDEASLREAAAAAGLRTESLTYTQGGPFWAVSLMNEIEGRGRRRKRTPGTAMVDTRAFQALLALTAPIDLVRSKFVKTSQMVGIFSHADHA